MLKFIGEILTPYNKLEECPRNIDENGPECKLSLFEEYASGLNGLKNGGNILILYWLDIVRKSDVEQRSLDTNKITGVFSLRSPHRPNPIGVAVVEIISIENNVVTVKGLDCLNKTKLLDIKPAILKEI